MGENGAITTSDDPRIHPFFSASKHTAKPVPPVATSYLATPDPSCSPNSDVQISPTTDNLDSCEQPWKRRRTDLSSAEPDNAETAYYKSEHQQNSDLTWKHEASTPLANVTNSMPQQHRSVGLPTNLAGIRVGHPPQNSTDAPRTLGSPTRHILCELPSSTQCRRGGDQSDLANPSFPFTMDDPKHPELAAPPGSSRMPDYPQSGPAENRDSHASSTPRPQKLLRLNPKTGTIGSPPKPKPNGLDEPTAVDGPAVKAKRGRKSKSLVVSLAWGRNHNGTKTQMAQRIQEILASHAKSIGEVKASHTPTHQKGDTPKSDITSGIQAQAQSPPELSTKALKQSPNDGQQNSRRNAPTAKKATHPFFLGKPKAIPPSPVENTVEKPRSPTKKNTIFTSTPCSPNHTRRGPTSTTMKIHKPGGLRFPGSLQPAWPWSGIAHVRGCTPADENFGGTEHLSRLKLKKSKGQQVYISDHESVMARISSNLGIPSHIRELASLNSEQFQPPPQCLRLPQRHLESGPQLQMRVKSQLAANVGGHDTTAKAGSKPHPAVLHAYLSLNTALSAFDRSTCESSTWTQKYAPLSADQVLQAGREALLLRDWLRTLKVQSVDTGVAEPATSKLKGIGTVPKLKRKRKKLDGFIVSSDESEDELDEISDADDDRRPNNTQDNGLKTVIRAGDAARNTKDGARLTNCVILSGPPGCGKTATVFAIAKELEFEVFEINSGSRRSGKDILEKVGDMTRNHLVQHKQNDVDQQTNSEQHEDEVARELQSGKQGVMTSFFKAQGTQPNQVKTTLPSTPSGAKAVKKQPSSNQKQSLILVEEADVLYDEDKQFWPTLLTLISQSKRPFIITCNDETLVPLQSLNLHGIFRFHPAPLEMAVDLMLLIAASEGHILKRAAVEALYNSRGNDLRASISELNYWCQLGVGDTRGGFDWFYPRWPRGHDKDHDGHTIRVASENTYEMGMGWCSRDALLEVSVSRTVPEEIQQQAWQGWNVDVLGSQSDDALESWARSCGKLAPAQARHEALLLTDHFTDMMSAMDVCSLDTYAHANDQAISATEPELPIKSRDDFTNVLRLLEAPAKVIYDTLTLDITSAMRWSANWVLNSELVHGDLHQLKMHLDDSTLTREAGRGSVTSEYRGSCITRVDYSMAFDPIAETDKGAGRETGSLDPSVFDRPMRLITLDVAPYVRSIVAYDQQLQQERLLKSSLLSEGSNSKPGKKRMRTTRSAYSALEGGSRASTRREKYFSAEVNPYLVMNTGGEGWNALTLRLEGSKDHQASEDSATRAGCEEVDATRSTFALN